MTETVGFNRAALPLHSDQDGDAVMPVGEHVTKRRHAHLFECQLIGVIGFPQNGRDFPQNRLV